MQNRRRQPKGTPEGGQFAAEPVHGGVAGRDGFVNPYGLQQEGGSARPSLLVLSGEEVAQVEALTGRIAGSREVTGGHTPATKLILTTERGEFFVKVAERGDWCEAAYRQEAGIHEWLPVEASGGLHVGSIETDSAYGLLFKAPATVGDPWTWSNPQEISTTLKHLNTVYGPLQDAAPTGLPSSLEGDGFWASQSFFRDATEKGALPSGATARQLEALAKAEAEAIPTLLDAGLGGECAHHDVRRDNILVHPNGGATLIDWSIGEKAPVVVDAFGLGISIAKNGYDPNVAYSSTGPFHQYSREVRAAITVLGASYFQGAAGDRAGKPARLVSSQAVFRDISVKWALQLIGR